MSMYSQNYKIQVLLGEVVWRKVLYLIEIYNFHAGSFSWIILNHGENFAQSFEKNMKFPTLRKISKFRNFDFSKWNLDFFISWWTSFIFWYVLMNCDLCLILTNKSKFDSSVCSWLLISWLKINYQLIDLEQCFESCH